MARLAAVQGCSNKGKATAGLKVEVLVVERLAMALNGRISGKMRKNQALPREGKAKELST